jgi:hypothetical protein
MTPLPELQRQFAAAVLEDAPDVQAHIRPGRFGAARHLQIHKNNTFASLTEALTAVFPVTQKLVSDKFFAFAADRYIREQPPRGGNLHDFGRSFPAFLAGFEPAQTLAYLPDVARLEWAWHEAFHAADAEPFAIGRLAAVNESQYQALRFRLHPSARLIESEYPILRIWQANLAGSRDIPPVDLTGGGVRLLVLRPALEVEIEPLGAGDNALLQALAEGGTFADASDRALGRDPSYDLAARLGYFVQRTAITDFTLT